MNDQLFMFKVNASHQYNKFYPCLSMCSTFCFLLITKVPIMQIILNLYTWPALYGPRCCQLIETISACMMHLGPYKAGHVHFLNVPVFSGLELCPFFQWTHSVIWCWITAVLHIMCRTRIVSVVSSLSAVYSFFLFLIFCP